MDVLITPYIHSNILLSVSYRKFTREEKNNGSIAFLDVLVTREDDGKLSTRIYRKPSNTNVTVKPQSCQHPNTVIGIFKSEMCRAYRLCSSPELVRKEIEYALDLFEDNGHNRAVLEKVAKEYKPPDKRSKNQNKNTKEKSKKNENSHNEIP